MSWRTGISVFFSKFFRSNLGQMLVAGLIAGGAFNVAFGANAVHYEGLLGGVVSGYLTYLIGE